jgi:hypothetical protein
MKLKTKMNIEMDMEINELMTKTDGKKSFSTVLRRAGNVWN